MGYNCDHLGSVINLTDSNKNVKNSYRYYAFGGILSSTEDVANVYRFTGEEHDADPGLVYLRARYYDPEIGRFISRDPLLEQVALAGGGAGCSSCGGGGGGSSHFSSQKAHPYLYVEDNPVNYTDPSGRMVGDYGNYCGWTNTDDAYKKEPVDCVDAACKRHDKCLDDTNSKCWKIWRKDVRQCHEQLCSDLKTCNPSSEDAKKQKKRIEDFFHCK